MFSGAASAGSITPPPANLGGLGLFGAAAQRFSNVPGTQAALAAAAAAAAGLGIRGAANGTTVNHLGAGTNINLMNANMFNPNGVAGNVATVNKIRHNSGDKAASNRSKLLEDFRYVNYSINYNLLRSILSIPTSRHIFLNISIITGITDIRIFSCVI